MAQQMRCPTCKTVCAVPEAEAGSPLRCPACSSNLTVDSRPQGAGPKSKAGKRPRRPKRRQRTGPGPGLLVGVRLGAVALLLVLALGIYALTRRAHPPQPAAAPAEEGAAWGAVWADVRAMLAAARQNPTAPPGKWVRRV